MRHLLYFRTIKLPGLGDGAAGASVWAVKGETFEVSDVGWSVAPIM